jgi:alpha-soluble NSF attachment protein
MDYTQMAKDEEKSGNKKLEGGFWSNMFSNKSERGEEAIESFKRAANYYKLAAKWEESAMTYQKCARLSEDMKEFTDAARNLSDAGDMYMKVNTAKGIKCLEQACAIYCKDGKMNYAAKIYKQMAETQEAELEYELAIVGYEKAAELFELDKYGQSEWSKNIQKVAHL